jgi:hypothetical protein
MAMRQDDREQRTYFRSERLVSMNGQWYFCTREGEQGPFPSKGAAQRALQRYINEKVELDGFQRSRKDAPAVKRRPVSEGPLTLELVPLERTSPPALAPAPTLPKKPLETRNLVF